MSVCKIKYDWIVFSEGHPTLRGQYFTHNTHLYVCRFSRTPPCTRYIACLDPSSGAFFKRVLGYGLNS